MLGLAQGEGKVGLAVLSEPHTRPGVQSGTIGTSRPTYAQAVLAVLSEQRSMAITDKQSQRDFAPKPRVARHELPWVRRGKRASTPTGLRQRRTAQTQPRWGWARYEGGVPRVGAARQPFGALVQNPVGIPGWMLGRAVLIAPTQAIERPKRHGGDTAPYPGLGAW